MLHRRSAFTLLEILIVLVILGIIASLAIPDYQAQVERSRAAEAFKRIKLTRESLESYHAYNATYLGASIPVFGQGTLDFNPNDTPNNDTLYFTYTLRNLGPNTYTVRATRNSWQGCTTIGRIDVDQFGNVNGTGVYQGF